MTVHSFTEQLAYSEERRDEWWWEVVYRSFFGSEFEAMHDVIEAGDKQRKGIDRVIYRRTLREVFIDEKVRRKDYGDVLLERWSDVDRKVDGWAVKPLDAHFIAYAIEPAQTCYMLPVLPLQRAVAEYGEQWWKNGQDGKYGFKIVVARNRAGSRTWRTASVSVPTELLLSAMNCACAVSWEDQ